MDLVHLTTAFRRDPTDSDLCAVLSDALEEAGRQFDAENLRQSEQSLWLDLPFVTGHLVILSDMDGFATVAARQMICAEAAWSQVEVVGDTVTILAVGLSEEFLAEHSFYATITPVWWIDLASDQVDADLAYELCKHAPDVFAGDHSSIPLYWEAEQLLHAWTRAQHVAAD